MVAGRCLDRQTRLERRMHQIPAAARIALILILLLRLVIAQWTCRGFRRSQLSSCAMTSPSHVVCSMEVLELGAPQIHSAAEAPRRGPTQLATRQAAPQGRSCVQVVGCPGPKSRGIGARLVAEEGNFARSTQSDTAFTQPSCSYADVRVGSNSGRRLPGTTLDGTADTQRAVKPLDPFFFDACGQAIGVLVISYARHIVSRSQQVFVQGVLAHHMLFFLASVIGLVAGFMLLWRPPQSVYYAVVRVRPGAYRRRRLSLPKVHATTVPGCRPHTGSSTANESAARTACLPSQPHKVPNSRPTRLDKSTSRPASVSWVLAVLVVALLPASVESSRQPKPGRPPQEIATLTAYGHTARMLSFSRKRSFKRAQKRALRDGTTVYRGRTHTASGLALQDRTRIPKTLSPTIPANSLKIVTWNAGGLHSSRYVELMSWLETHDSGPIHVCCVHESHWPSSSEYSNHRWVFVHTGSSSSTGGVLMIINRSVACPAQLQHAELHAGRLLHVRVQSEPAVDLLGTYQHAWNPNSKQRLSTAENGLQLLLRQRQEIWDKIESWAAAVPKRNRLILLGDMNVSLRPCPPHVGLGCARSPQNTHSDLASFERIIMSQGLVALNTWRKPGRPSSTFVSHSRHFVQLDYVLTRLPTVPFALRSTALHDAPIVHPSGLRHVPVICTVPAPVVPRRSPQSCTPTARHVRDRLSQDATLLQRFQQEVQTALHPGPHNSDLLRLDSCLVAAWQKASRSSPTCKHQPQPTPGRNGSLKDFWASKSALRLSASRVENYLAPLLWHIAESSRAIVLACAPRALQQLRPLLRYWRQAVIFARLDRNLRKQVKESKKQKLDALVQEAQQAEARGITHVHQLSRSICPKAPKRSIHFRTETGRLMTREEELRSLVDFFQELYQSASPGQPPQHSLQASLQITREEISAALSNLSPNKALPANQAPAALWKVSASSLIEPLYRHLNQALEAGPLRFPAEWYRAFLVLLPKQGKPPCSPGNLRPITLLPAVPKLLARIAAERLKPYLLQALQHAPQFAYLQGRQSLDAVDRVLTHCHEVRSALKQQQRTVFTTFAGTHRCSLAGGVQLSLDLSRAYDKLPRVKLAEALQRVQAPPDLISLILHIHDHARVVISKHDLHQEIFMQRGIRQGCGLSPLLWLSFTLLLHDKVSVFMGEDATTGFADDYHFWWVMRRAQDFRNCCSQIVRIIQTLQSLGMDVSTDKTVVLVALKGKDAASLLKTHTMRRLGRRFLQLQHPAGSMTLPLKHTHTYLGVRISYGHFERKTAKHRLQLAWVAFHRLHRLLKHPLLPVSKRIQLWQSSVWSIARYGISATGVDDVSAQLLHSQFMRQLRMVARSPAHISRESNAQLLARLGLESPIATLATHCANRVQASSHSVGHLQAPNVQQWWTLVLSGLRTALADITASSPPASLQEVTEVVNYSWTCAHCSQHFPSFHALNVHVGKKHPESRAPKEPHRPTRNRITDAYRCHAKQGLPWCKHCDHKFHSWAAFMGHHSQKACSVLYASVLSDTAGLAGATNTVEASPPTVAPALEVNDVSSPDVFPNTAPPFAHGVFAPEGGVAAVSVPVVDAEADRPIFYRTHLQQLAENRDLRALASAIRACAPLNFCPECGQWCAQSVYITRHAVRMHESVRLHEKQVERWMQARGRIRRPCEWCDEWYGSRPLQHLAGCPVLWMCAHFLARFASLADTSQPLLQDVFARSADRRGASGTGHVRGPDGQTSSLTLHWTSVKRGVTGGDPQPRTGSHGRGRQQGETSSVSGGDRADSTYQVCQRRQQGRPQAGRAASEWQRAPLPLNGARTGWSQEGLRAQAGAELGQPGSPTAGTLQLGPWAVGPPVLERAPAAGLRPGGSPEGDGSVLGTTVPPDGRRVGRSQPGLRVHSLPSDQNRQSSDLHHRRSVQHSLGLEGTQRGGSHQPLPANAKRFTVLPPHVPPASVAGTRDGRDQVPASQGEGTDRGQELPLPPVEPGAETPHQSHSGAHLPRGDGPSSRSDAQANHLPERCREVPRSAPVGSQHGFGRDSFCPHPPDAQPRESTDARLHESSLALQLLAPHRCDGPPGEVGALPSGNPDREDAPIALSPQPGSVLGTSLHNASNHCYANASILSIAWTAAQLPAGLLIHHRPMGRFLQWLFRWPQGSSLHLWHVRAWRRLVSTWQDPHAQHDCAEFLQHLRSAFCPEGEFLQWQARTLPHSHARAEVSDQGHLWPLTIPVALQLAAYTQTDSESTSAAGSISLQKLLILWRNQAEIHAAVSLPSVFPIQINRFNSEGNKVHHRINLHPSVYVPQFSGSGLRTVSQRFVVTAVIYHIGPTRDSGHYRAALFARDALIHVTDDGVCSQLSTEGDRDIISKNAYIFFLRHAP